MRSVPALAVLAVVAATAHADAADRPTGKTLPGLPPATRLDATLGRVLFERVWVGAPASTRSADGLGPLFNARSCAGCHAGAGAGSLVTEPDGSRRGMVLRLATPDGAPDPVYGRQLQDKALPGLLAEATASLAVASPAVGEGSSGSPRHWTITGWNYGLPHDDVIVSPRFAPSLWGAGLLGAVPTGEIAALADPDDANGDGISGRLNTRPGAADGRLGRFGRKAAEPDLHAQVATALALDLGLGTPERPEPWGDCTAAEAACRAGPHGDDGRQQSPEIPAPVLHRIILYVATLAPAPRRTPDDPDIRTGERVFAEIGCAACHVPTLTTAADAEPAVLASRTIRPFTDLLLHDMGDGLADRGPSEGAAAAEWRTSPLWGIGAPGARKAYLHDGRAGSLTEAILWHDGEARAAKTRFADLTPRARAQLLRFLESL